MNWKKAQTKFKWMIEEGLGAESCTITVPASIIYDRKFIKRFIQLNLL